MRVGASTYEVKVALEEIADRIDQEHEDELTMERGRAITKLGSDIALNYIQLPKDADGEHIRIGDELETYHYEDGTVAGIQYYETGRVLIAVRPHGWDTPTWNDPEDYTHAQPDSWERIIEDAQADGVRYHNDGRPSDFDALVERCKRLAGEDA